MNRLTIRTKNGVVFSELEYNDLKKNFYKAVEQLAYYEDMEEQGKLLVSKYSLGTNFYYSDIGNNCVIVYSIYTIEFNQKADNVWVGLKDFPDEKEDLLIYEKDLGKYPWFLTRKEAEDSLVYWDNIKSKINAK